MFFHGEFVNRVVTHGRRLEQRQFSFPGGANAKAVSQYLGPDAVNK